MRISDAKTELETNGFSLVEIRKNPSNMEEYIALLHGHGGKTFMLADENNAVISSSDLNQIVLLLREIGFRRAKIHF